MHWGIIMEAIIISCPSYRRQIKGSSLQHEGGQIKPELVTSLLWDAKTYLSLPV